MGNHGPESHGSEKSARTAGSPEKDSTEQSLTATPWVTMGRKATGPRECGQPGRLENLIRKEFFMRKMSLCAALCLLGLLMLPCVASAQMVPLSDDQLSEIVGQAGIDFNQHIDNMSGMGGLMNYSDVTIIGSVDSRNIFNVDTNYINQMSMPGLGMMGLGYMGLNTMGLGTHVIDMTIDIALFSIDAIRIGNDPAGPSLGSLYISGLHADIKGTVSITAH
jgi:hypothetical protein